MTRKHEDDPLSMLEPEDGEGALYFVKPKEKLNQQKIDEIEEDLQLDLKAFDRFAMGLMIFFGLVVITPVVGLLIAAAYKWWTK